jgi:hypothetical protein
MRRNARISLFAAGVLALAACGGEAEDSAGNSLPIIHLAAGGSAAGASGAAEDALSMPMRVANVRFVAAGELPALDTPATAWRYPAGAQPDPAAVARIAEAFGVTGELVALAADQGGGWVVGPTDGSAGAVYVSADPTLSWYYSAPWTDEGWAAVECETVDPAVGEATSDTLVAPVDTVVVPPDTPVGTAVDGSSVERAVAPSPVPVCPEPEPPVGVPTAAAAEASARSLMTSIGLDPEAYTLETYADEWGAGVTAWGELDGIRSPMSVSVGYGAEGAVTYAGGTLAEPVAVGEYPRVGTAVGLERLNSDWMERYWAAADGPMPLAAAAEADAGAPAGGADVAAPEPAPDAVPDTGPVVEPEEIVITVVAVEADLWQVWDRDGATWLLPAYAFVDADGGRSLIPAVPDEYLDIAPAEEVPLATEPVPDTAPAGSDVPATEPPATTPDTTPDPTEPGVVLPTDADAASIVGLDESEAQQLVEERGWVFRVVQRDGVDLAVTMDYREDRLNAQVADGVVIAATVG